jgi:uncharacterized membrane protein YbaN (DUF454 family)
MTALLFRCGGMLALGLGLLGVFVPLLPTTIFLIIAVACFLRSDPERAERLYADARFGPALRAWRDHGAISIGGKIGAGLGITLSFAIIWLFVPLGPRPLMVIAAVLVAVAAYILTRPTATYAVQQIED